ncbi:chemotaxis protein CheW [Salinispirillum marinum]|uniref:Chemotaxis protein CheW n=2 Tax=Saccharospirillaceae TaxID=255527 RepID=A0ABV8BFR4_9GAMM
MAQVATPFQALLDLNDRYRAAAAGLPEQEAFVETWTGIAYRLAGCALVTPMNQVSEILTPPPFTRLPGVKSWVLGVANVRGRLVPLIDLCDYLGIESAATRQNRRVLMVEMNDLLFGLRVDQVIGMQHFNVDNQQELTVDLPPEFDAYTEGAYQWNKEIWNLFSMEKLVNQPNFLHVAA